MIETANIGSTRIAQKFGFKCSKASVMRQWPAEKGGGERELAVWVWEAPKRGGD